MPVEQAGSNPPEKQSYDAEIMADVRSAWNEEAGKTEPVVDAPEPKVEPETKAAPENVEPEKIEPKADHPTDEKRYADGTFKPTKEEAEAAAPAKVEQENVEPAPVQTEQQQAAPTAGNPPGGFSPKTKAEWEKIVAAYPHLAADIAKREKEIADGFAQYEGMRELRPYVEMARAQGQTLKQALDRYTGIEAALRNPQQALNAVLHVASNAGYTPQRLAMELAPYLGPSTGQPNDAPVNGAQPPFDPSMLQPLLNPLVQQIQSIESRFQQQSEAQRTREMSAIGTAVERFKSDPAHRYYENVEPKMTQIIESGLIPRTGDLATDLQAAYDMACRLDPEISELILNDRIAKTEAARVKAEKEAGEKARQASRSITGSPSSTVRETDDDKGGSPFDDARRAYREVSGRA